MSQSRPVTEGHPLQNQNPKPTAPSGPSAASTSQASTPTPSPGAKLNTLLMPPESTSGQTQSRADLLLQSPDRFAESVVSEAVTLVRAEQQLQKNRDSMWTEFYKTHPDLKEWSDEVELVLGKRLGDWKDKPVPEATTLLANETRERLQSYKKRMGVKEEVLPQAPAVSLPSSGQPAPHVAVASNDPKSFIDEMREIRARKRKKF